LGVHSMGSSLSDASTVLEPTRVLDPESDEPLTPMQVASWREQGFALVQDLFPSELIAAARDEMCLTPPGPLTRGLKFPSSSNALNTISTHQRLRSAVAQLLLHESGLQLLQSEAWSKRAPDYASLLRGAVGGNAFSNSDQRMHMDYPNHYLTHPAPWAAPEAVVGILYFDDGAECGGMTRVVPRDGPEDDAYASPLLSPCTDPKMWCILA